MIHGRPIVKKNNRQIVRSGGRPISLPSKAYKKYEGDAIPQILEQTRGKKLDGRLVLGLKFYIKGKYHVDLDNLISSICDILQASGTIKDDDLIDVINAIKLPECKEWKTEINLDEYQKN